MDRFRQLEEIRHQRREMDVRLKAPGFSHNDSILQPVPVARPAVASSSGGRGGDDGFLIVEAIKDSTSSDVVTPADKENIMNKKAVPVSPKKKSIHQLY